MRQEERKRQSRDKILRAAMEEFGARDFDAVTMETVCGAHGISKGMMYHYYAGKDELFLACAEYVFSGLLERVERESPALDARPPLEALKGYFAIRSAYFEERPEEKNVFENALLRTPKHLAEQMARLHRPLRAANRRFLKNVLLRLPPRSGVSADRALRYIECAGNYLSAMLREYRRPEEPADLRSMLAASEELLDMLLFGVACGEPGH